MSTTPEPVTLVDGRQVNLIPGPEYETMGFVGTGAAFMPPVGPKDHEALFATLTHRMALLKRVEELEQQVPPKPLYDLKEIERVANEALRQQWPKSSYGAFAERREDSRGDVEYFVTIDECSPTDTKVSQFVSDAIGAAGFEHIQIETEW
jgi:hypothetical protein